MLRPLFVTLEGPEGAGKTSLMKALAEEIRREGREVLTTREPGDGLLGPKIRNILLEGEVIDPKAELLLFLADRAQHVAEVIRPALARGAFVICDRYVDSTLAYQGYGRGLDVQALREWNDFATGGLEPDLTLLLDLEPAVGLARIGSKDRLDSEPLSFHSKVRDGFLTESAMFPERWAVLNAEESLPSVTKKALDAVKERQTRKT